MSDGTRFCTSCGSVVAAAAAVQAAPAAPSMFEQSVQLRKESLSELGRMIEYFGRKQDLYFEYDVSNVKLNKLMRGTSVAPLVWGIILCVFMTLPVIALIDTIFKGRANSGTLTGLFVFGILFLLGIGLIIMYICKKAGRGKEVRRLLGRVAQIADELTQYYIAFGYSAVGAEYTNPEILMKIADVLRSGRADSPKEAINIMLVDSRRNMMQLQATLSGQAARQAQGGAPSAAVFCAASFFFRR